LRWNWYVDELAVGIATDLITLAAVILPDSGDEFVGHDRLLINVETIEGRLSSTRQDDPILLAVSVVCLDAHADALCFSVANTHEAHEGLLNRFAVFLHNRPLDAPRELELSGYVGCSKVQSVDHVTRLLKGPCLPT